MRSLVLALLVSATLPAVAADSTNLQTQLDNTVKPFVGKYCVGCHSGTQPTAQFDLKSYTTVDQVKEDFPRWSLLADRLTAHEMPPKQMPQPSADDAQKFAADHKVDLPFVIDPQGVLVYRGGLDNAPLGQVEAGAGTVNYVDAALADVHLVDEALG